MSYASYIYLLIVLPVINAVFDEVDVQYIVDTVEGAQANAFTYNLPENAYEYQPTNTTLADYGTYDYIVIGAGSAGSVIATRLSEDQDTTVLLLEAGGRASKAIGIPALMVYQQGSQFNWNYKTTPQTTCCLGMIDHRCLEPRGRGLGGTSLINGMIYVRGNRHDYDSWVLQGNPGWSYNELLQYFKKSENSQIQGDPGYHRRGGLLNVDPYTSGNTIRRDAFLEAAQERGDPIVDYNGRQQEGASYTQLTILNGVRDHTGKAFLAGAQNRPNIKILPYSYVTKIEIDKHKRATGVLFSHNGQAAYASAKKEIVLSAGAIMSPQILMLSGIGPAKQLKSLNIPVIKDLPVGEQYLDHPTYWGLYITTNTTSPPKSVQEYATEYLKQYGMYTATGDAAISFFRTKSAKTPAGVPNLEVLVRVEGVISDYTQLAYNYDNETYNNYFAKINGSTTINMIVILVKPKSVGTLTLNSSNPYDYPLINPNFLSDENNEDIEALYEGINAVRDLLNTTAFKKIDAQVFPAVLPQCQNLTFDSKEQWFCQIRHLTSHLYHPMGTCKMAPSPLLGGVVDHELKVHGIKRLRVADASIVPEVIAAHTNVPSITIGEKTADMLKNTIYLA